MRIRNLICADVKFQWKYGFYTIYLILVIVYILILSMLKGVVKTDVGIIMIYSDPAAMGMFFMGAIVLLEKSQRVLDSIAISPVTPRDYIVSKIVSIGIIGTVVGVVLAIATGCNNLPLVALGIFLASTFFTMFGLIVGGNVNSLNQYIIATIPFETIGFLPPIAYILGYQPSWMLLHPGCVCIRFIAGESDNWFLLIWIVVAWILLCYKLTEHMISKMFAKVGGIKL